MKLIFHGFHKEAMIRFHIMHIIPVNFSQYNL